MIWHTAVGLVLTELVLGHAEVVFWLEEEDWLDLLGYVLYGLVTSASVRVKTVAWLATDDLVCEV